MTMSTSLTNAALVVREFFPKLWFLLGFRHKHECFVHLTGRQLAWKGGGGERSVFL
jgi:hypothetical protein